MKYRNLTLTSVVFELGVAAERGVSVCNLTLTSVVFELRIGCMKWFKEWI